MVLPVHARNGEQEDRHATLNGTQADNDENQQPNRGRKRAVPPVNYAEADLGEDAGPKRIRRAKYADMPADERLEMIRLNNIARVKKSRAKKKDEDRRLQEAERERVTRMEAELRRLQYLEEERRETEQELKRLQHLEKDHREAKQQLLQQVEKERHEMEAKLKSAKAALPV